MNPKQHEETLFAAALEFPAEERAAFMDKACAGDRELRRRVEVLLNAHGGAAFLEKPAAGIASQTVRISSELIERPGDRIRHYKLLEQIGEGGCGVVYMAEQQEPVKRQVALKIIKLGMDTKQVIARFDAERQALALMDHANIAKVFDGGATETGRPYFVMELIRGVKITEYCDQNNLTTQQRLELFLQVCRAVQHAHSKGIIHRDIKPSNILVTSHDGVPVPKVIDFGIAKATQGKLTDLTLFTAFEQLMGTPAYMSPEQAEMSGLDIDTRSDIYSLGVLLYELLTGKTPFDAQELIAAGLDALRRTIREKEPDRPSTRLSTMLKGDLINIAKKRQAQPLKLISSVRGDLDWIVMRCLEKDRNRRYETANDLAMDLHRHLNEEPVAARPPSNTYRLQKLVRRNKLAIGAATVVLVSLLAGLGVALWMYAKEKTAAQRSEQYAQFLKDALEGVGPAVALGRDTAIVRGVLVTTLTNLHSTLTNQPAIQSDLLSTIGHVYQALNDYTNAENNLREALKIRIALWGENNRYSATSMDDLGVVLIEQSKLNEAEVLLRKGLAIRKKLLGPEHPEIATSIYNFGALLQVQGKYTDAEEWDRKSLKMRKKLLGDDDLQVAESLFGVASALYHEEKNLDEAEKLNREVLAIRKKHFGDVHPDIASVWNNLGTVYQMEGKSAAAADAFQQCADQYHNLLKEGSVGEALALHNQSWMLCNGGDYTNAELVCRKSLEMRERILGAQHDYIADSLNMLAIIFQRKGDLEHAEQFQEKELRMRIALHGEDPMLVLEMNTLASIYRGRRKFLEAESMQKRALDLSCKSGDQTNATVVQLLHNFAAIKADLGLLSEAEQLHRDALSRRRTLSGKDDRFVANSQMLLAHTLLEENKFTDAEREAKQGTEIMRAELPDSWSRFCLETLWGRSFVGLTDYSAGEQLLVSGVGGMERLLEKMRSDQRFYFVEAVESLARLYEANKKPEEAAKWREKIPKLAQESEKKNAI